MAGVADAVEAAVFIGCFKPETKSIVGSDGTEVEILAVVDLYELIDAVETVCSSAVAVFCPAWAVEPSMVVIS